ncbi:MAG: hypothetical protein HY482_00895 [Candidatus Wildermuthbacteria bacterium]|nr:hypothetical protein [Candidatus Wildermuthbacteria bacterium]
MLQQPGSLCSTPVLAEQERNRVPHRILSLGAQWDRVHRALADPSLSPQERYALAGASGMDALCE